MAHGGPPKDVSPSPDAAIDILSTDGAPNEMLGAPWDRPVKSAMIVCVIRRQETTAILKKMRSSVINSFRISVRRFALLKEL